VFDLLTALSLHQLLLDALARGTLHPHLLAAPLVQAALAHNLGTSVAVAFVHVLLAMVHTTALE
jgi:hypothetical protein